MSRHGTVTSYSNGGCRCDDCRQANADYRRQRRAEMTPASEPARLFEPPPPWFQFAACNPRWADRPLDQWVDLFFPTSGESTREAKEICDECPAKAACADHAMATGQTIGIWGGTSERERRRIRRARTRTA